MREYEPEEIERGRLLFAAGVIAGSEGARGNMPGTDQRSAMIYASMVDLEEAFVSILEHAS